jgi:hypothetical protein
LFVARAISVGQPMAAASCSPRLAVLHAEHWSPGTGRENREIELERAPRARRPTINQPRGAAA